MPPGSTMAAIAERGRLIVGVDQNTNPFGYRDPASGQLEGFDIDVAREIARAIFGDPDRIDLRVYEADQRVPVLQSGQVDLVVRTFSITCGQRRSSISRRLISPPARKSLVVKGSGRLCRRAFGQTGVCGDGHDIADGLACARLQADGDSRDQLDRLPGDAATGTGRCDQHRRLRAGRAQGAG
jgi:polar amino acid transport system substrate-binding protein